MERLVAGDVVVVPFPCSDLSGAKRRPALVVGIVPGNDVILCQITSVVSTGSHVMALSSADFVSGELTSASWVKPGRLFTADASIIVRKIGRVK